MSNNLEPKSNDRIKNPVEPDIKKGNSSSSAPAKPQTPPPAVSPAPKPNKL